MTNLSTQPKRKTGILFYAIVLKFVSYLFHAMSIVWMIFATTAVCVSIRKVWFTMKYLVKYSTIIML